MHLHLFLIPASPPHLVAKGLSFFFPILMIVGNSSKILTFLSEMNCSNMRDRNSQYLTVLGTCQVFSMF